MYVLIEIQQTDRDMTVRYVGTFKGVGRAMRAAKCKRDELSHKVTRDDFGYSYKHHDNHNRMAWLDVVYKDHTSSYTWTIIDTDNKAYIGRYFG